MTEKKISNEQLRAAILRTAEATRTFEDVDVDGIAAQACRNYWKARPLMISFQRDLVREAHRDDSWRERRAVRRATPGERGFQDHLAECKKCQALLAPVVQYLAELARNRRS